MYLPHQDHFIAHQILAEENPENHGLFYAYWRMCNGRVTEATPEEYEEARRRFSQLMQGENHPNYGKTWTLSDEARIKIGKSHLGKKPMLGKHHTEETRLKMRNSHVGLKASEETKAKMSKALSGERNPMYGKTHNEDARKKMSESWKPHNYNLVCKRCNKIFLKDNPAYKYCDECKRRDQ